ncbi:MAG: succinylglutamate desuccinylase [Chitinivorax sp.]
MRAGERYLDDDLNRLFGGKHQFLSGLREARRAALLEQYAQRFEMGVGNGCIWICTPPSAPRSTQNSPFARRREIPLHRQPARPPLQAVDVGTLPPQPQPSNTFSSYCRSQFGARALTLELGQARPFGQNQSLPLDEWLALLPRLLQGQLPAASAPLNIRRFAVTREVIRSSEQFVLHLADDVANFTPLPAGYLLAEDGAQQTIVAAGEHILFPNPAVKVGLRAGVLVAAIDA